MRRSALQSTALTVCLALWVSSLGCSQPGAPDDDAASPEASRRASGVRGAELPPEPFRLRWKFKDDDLFEWSYECGMEIEGPQGGRIVKAALIQRMDFDVRVTAEADDLFSLHYDLARLQLTSDAPDLPINYDSAAPSPDSDGDSDDAAMRRYMEESMAEWLNLELRAVVDSRGQNMSLDASGGPQDVSSQQGLDALLFLVQPDGLNSLHAGGFVVLPDQPIAPGDVWEQTTDVPCQFGTIQFAHRATLVGPEVIDAVELLHFRTSIQGTMVPKYAALGDMIKFEDAGGSGELYFNHEAGQLDSYRYRANVTMTFLPPGEGQESLSGRISYVSNTFLKRVP